MFHSISIPAIKTKINLRFSTVQFSLFAALFFIFFYNAAFFGEMNGLAEDHNIRGIIFRINVALLLWSLTFILLSLITLPYISKPVVGFLFIGAASVAYCMDTYGIVIHRLMIQNMVETDTSEVLDLLSVTLFLYILFLGILPAFLLRKIEINFGSVKNESWKKLKSISIALVAALLLILSMSADYASFFRNHKNIRQMANPMNFIYAGISYITTSDNVVDVKPIENDAKQNTLAAHQNKPTLFIVVVGETARADHFGLNGYERDTTPLLAKQHIVNFTHVGSCGTETAVSVPCMFSSLGRENYSDNKAKSQEGLLDVINHAGISVLWRDNNSSCKGTCNRVAYEDVQHLKIPELCNERECFDEVLLHDIDSKVTGMQGNKVIVLHQKGSHGPDYFRRYPENAKRFSPVCETNRLQDCSHEEVINAFDNTIAYTDKFLNSTIEWLKTKKEYNTSLVYLSDHGESLGENHIYLHGMPYSIAPKEQKQVPLFFWFSKDFEQSNKIDVTCLSGITNGIYSHDNLFHTVLGLLNINTSVYRPELDMIKACRKAS